jgi:RNA-directed DNA polymerase
MEVLEKELKLTVNRRKTHLAQLEEGIGFLGFKIFRNYVLIKDGKVEKLKAKLKTTTRQHSGQSG